MSRKEGKNREGPADLPPDLSLSWSEPVLLSPLLAPLNKDFFFFNKICLVPLGVYFFFSFFLYLSLSIVFLFPFFLRVFASQAAGDPQWPLLWAVASLSRASHSSWERVGLTAKWAPVPSALFIKFFSFACGTDWYWHAALQRTLAHWLDALQVIFFLTELYNQGVWGDPGLDTPLLSLLY